MPAAHRVVGIGEVDELRVHLRRLGDQRLRVLPVAGIGHLVQDAAEARHVVVERRIGPVRGDDRVALGHQKAHEVAQKAVDPLAHDDVLGAMS
jgi:hypothetical protein